MSDNVITVHRVLLLLMFFRHGISIFAGARSLFLGKGHFFEGHQGRDQGTEYMASMKFRAWCLWLCRVLTMYSSILQQGCVLSQRNISSTFHLIILRLSDVAFLWAYKEASRLTLTLMDLVHVAACFICWAILWSTEPSKSGKTRGWIWGSSGYLKFASDGECFYQACNFVPVLCSKCPTPITEGL